MPAPTTTAELLELVRKSGLLEGDAVDGLAADASLPADPGAAADVLVGRGLLTRFQTDMLMRGKHRGYLIGPYKLCDRLAEGVAYVAEHGVLGRRAFLRVVILTAGDIAR